MTLLTKKITGIAMLVLTAISMQSFKSNKEKKGDKIQANQKAPTFAIKDVNGKNINLSDYKGKKVLLTFYRNVGCPVCNLRFHELEEQADYFKSKGLVVLAVYESSAENMKKYLEGETFYANMIPNPEQNLYSLYHIDDSMGKMMKGMFHGAMGKMKKGKKQFKTKIKQDGNKSTIGADFLIDENGTVTTAYYGKYIGDHLPLDDIKKFVN